MALYFLNTERSLHGTSRGKSQLVFHIRGYALQPRWPNFSTLVFCLGKGFFSFLCCVCTFRLALKITAVHAGKGNWRHVKVVPLELELDFRLPAVMQWMVWLEEIFTFEKPFNVVGHYYLVWRRISLCFSRHFVSGIKNDLVDSLWKRLPLASVITLH